MTDDITDRLDEIERLADDVSPYDHGDDTAPLHDAVPELVAAVRAVLALADDYERDGRSGPVQIAAHIRRTLTAALASPDAHEGRGRTPPAHGLVHDPACLFDQWREKQPRRPLPPDRPGGSSPSCTCSALAPPPRPEGTQR
jgi:hypothetical protein